MYAALHLTLGCNLRCTYCYAGAKVNKSMTPKMALESLDFLAKAAAAEDGYLSVTFIGGEPLMRFDLIKLLAERAKEYQSTVEIRFHMVTNGTLLTDEVIEFFRDHDILYTLSLDGDKTSQDIGRKTVAGKGSFDQIMERVPKILEADPYVKVNMVVSPQNAFNLYNSVKFLHETGFRYLEIEPDYGGAWDGSSFKILRKQYRKVADYYVEAHRQARKLSISLFDEKIRGHALHKVRPHGTPSPCSAGEKTISIAPSGRIYPCVEFVQDDAPKDWKSAIGDISNGIDVSKKCDFKASGSQGPKECEGCAFFERCHNYCACTNQRSTGDPSRPSAFVCEHERMLIPLADRIGAVLWKERNPLFVNKIYNEAHPILSYMEDALVDG